MINIKYPFNRISLFISAVFAVMVLAGCATTAQLDSDERSAVLAIQQTAVSISRQVAAFLPDESSLLIVPQTNADQTTDIRSAYFARQLGTELSTYESILLVSRQYTADVLNEVDFQSLRHWGRAGDPESLFDDETIARMGGFFGADHIAFVQVSDLTLLFEIAVSVVEIETMAYRQFSATLQKTEEIAIILGGETQGPGRIENGSERQFTDPQSPRIDRRRDSIELSMYNIFAPFDLDSEYSTGAQISLVEQSRRRIAFGGWLGLGVDVYPDPFVVPLIGVKAIVGDRLDGFAMSFNLGLPPSIGFYYRGVLFNALIVPIDGVLVAFTEIGYSIPLRRTFRETWQDAWAK